MIKEQLITIFQKCQELYAFDQKKQDLSNALYSHIASSSYAPIYDDSRVCDYLEGLKVGEPELARNLIDYYFDGLVGYNDKTVSFEFTGEDKDKVFFEYLCYIMELEFKKEINEQPKDQFYQ